MFAKENPDTKKKKKNLENMGMGVLVPVNTSTGIKVRTHCFSEKFRKGFSF